MEDNRTRIIGRAVDLVLHQNSSPLPKFSSLKGSSELLASLICMTRSLEGHQLIYLDRLIQEGDIQRLLEFLEDNIPTLIENCIDFYFSRTAVRVALSFQPFPVERDRLAKWEGP